jgi:hypothetical protein
VFGNILVLHRLLHTSKPLDMESPYNGRAIINDAGNYIQIVVPTRKTYLIIILAVLWLIPMGLGGIVGFAAAFIYGNAPFIIVLPMLIWVAVITFVGRVVWWMIAGKEIIEVDGKVLQIRQQGLLFSKPKMYDLAECRSFRTVDNTIANIFPFAVRTSLFNPGATGTVAFDYGMKTIKFAEGIDEAEGKHVLNALKEKNMLTDRNFS